MRLTRIHWPPGTNITRPGTWFGIIFLEGVHANRAASSCSTTCPAAPGETKDNTDTISGKVVLQSGTDVDGGCKGRAFGGRRATSMRFLPSLGSLPCAVSLLAGCVAFKPWGHERLEKDVGWSEGHRAQVLDGSAKGLERCRDGLAR